MCSQAMKSLSKNINNKEITDRLDYQEKQRIQYLMDKCEKQRHIRSPQPSFNFQRRPSSAKTDRQLKSARQHKKCVSTTLENK